MNDDERRERVAAIKAELLADPLLMAAVGLSIHVQGMKPVPAEAGQGEWRKVFDVNGLTQVEEAQSYLFAVQHDDGSWEYFSDAVIWDAETEPEWGDGGHGWELSREIWFRALPPPPKSSEVE